MASLIIFYILAALMTVSAVLMVTTRRILRSAILLLFTLLGTAGLYLLLNYHFLAMVQIAVYAGGILVLLIFGILLTNEKSSTKMPRPSLSKVIYGALAAIAGVAVVIFTLWKVNFVYASPQNLTGEHEISMKEIGSALIGTGKYQYLLSFEILSILLLAAIVGGILIARKR